MKPELWTKYKYRITAEKVGLEFGEKPITCEQLKIDINSIQTEKDRAESEGT